MRYEEAKEIMETMIKKTHLQMKNITLFEELALEVGIKALDDQIPRAIEYDEDDRNHCPRCWSNVNTEDDYCRSCGQAIYYDINKE